jgi:transcriptional regulator with XRE-family HTH domain
MSQTSSPTLRYDLVGSMHDEMTSGGGREGFISQFQPDTRKFSTFFSPLEKFSEQSFTQLPFQSMDYISNQGILSDSLLYRLYLEITASYSNNILFQSWQSQSSRVGGIPYHRVGVDVSTLLERQGSNSPQLPQFEIIRWIRTKTGLSQDRIARLAGVTRQTLYNWEKGEPIVDHNRQRLLQVKDVLERASSQHPTPISLVTWLDTPRGAEGYTPAQLLESNEIDKARLFAISSPSPRLKRAQSWVRHSVPEAFKSGEEHYDEALPPLEDDEFIEDLTSLENDVLYDGGNSIIS